jgi:hypothetical protein
MRGENSICQKGMIVNVESASLGCHPNLDDMAILYYTLSRYVLNIWGVWYVRAAKPPAHTIASPSLLR